MSIYILRIIAFNSIEAKIDFQPVVGCYRFEAKDDNFAVTFSGALYDTEKERLIKIGVEVFAFLFEDKRLVKNFEI